VVFLGLFKMGAQQYNSPIVKVRSSDFIPPVRELEDDPRWLLVQRIVASSGFVNSERLRAFLLFVSERALAGAQDSLNERSVGVGVFERSSDYDPRDDNIVRVYASRLRDRLEEYFEGEGTSESLVVHIRRGSYVPFVEERVPGNDQLGVDSSVFESKISVPSQDQILMIPLLWVKICLWALAFFVFITVSVAGIIVRYQDSKRMTPTHKLWSQLFRDDQQTLFVPADSNLVITRLLVGHQINLGDYAGGRYQTSTQCDKPCDPRLVETVEGLRYTSMSDLEFAVRVAHLPEANTYRTVIRYARDLDLKDLKESNLIMAGSQEADPWLAIISKQMSFVVHDDPSQGPLRVENKRPKKGEPSEYPYDPHSPQHQGLATISFLPNLNGSGSLLIVQGFSLAGTQAAAEFVTSGKDLDALLHAYSGNRTQLPHFEILLSTTEINGMASHPVPLSLHISP
jgi:hypothetical protein